MALSARDLGMERVKVWWKRPLLALVRHAMGQPGIRSNAGTQTVLAELSRLYGEAQRGEGTRMQHGFVKLLVPRLPMFKVEDDLVIVRNAAGRMKAVHAYSMRGYVAAVRANASRIPCHASGLSNSARIISALSP
jgi:hypothetical protein